MQGFDAANGVPDLVLMSELSEDEIYKQLKLRLENKQIYTYIGEVVISVNPYTRLPIYGEDVIKSYSGTVAYQNDPHVYALAESLYTNMSQKSENQTVLISGESGAGKTEAAKKILEYIAAVSKTGGAVGKTSGMLLGSNPILEAFGNAKTVRNDNSSRFGKYMEIAFDFSSMPLGGKITQFLLEKVRVVRRAPGERAFHIFYMMLKGLPDAQFAKLCLPSRDPNQFKYLASSECTEVKGFDDAKEFRIMTDAMKMLGFSEEDQMTIWQIITGVLLMGNLVFIKDKFKTNADASVLENEVMVDVISKLWNTDPRMLKRALVERTMTTAGKSVNVFLDEKQAPVARDALAKAVYSGLFDYVIKTLNAAISVPSNTQTLSIGILDIYGFEIFDNNSFEQFCINWCNESLQQYFIELTLKTEQEEYEREGIEWTPIEFFNNQIIVDLITAPTPKPGKPGTPGLLAMINEASTLGRVTDMQLLDRMIKVQAKSEYFVGPNQRSKGARDFFTIKHYAGDVSYKIVDFVSKNRDTLFQDQVNTMKNSRGAVCQQLMENVNFDGQKRPESAGTKFKKSLAALVQTLRLCRPSYVRCIKPNERKAALSCDEERFRHQIRYLGLLENVRVRRAGFCFRETYELFLGRYKMLADATWPQWRGSAREGTEEIIKAMGFSADQYQFGNTKVFIKEPPQLFQLEAARKEKLPGIAAMIQSAYRASLARAYVKKLAVVVKLQSHFRGYRQRVNFAQNKAAATIQRMAKAKLILNQYRQERASFLIKRTLRKHIGRKYVDGLLEVYADASVDNQFGAHRFETWPTPPGGVAPHVAVLQKMCNRWRYRRLLDETKEHEPLLREKVIAFDAFAPMKKPWVPHAKWKDDHKYVDSPAFDAAVGKIMQDYQGTETVLFADTIEKMQPNGKMAPRTLILTNNAIYKLDEKFKPKPPVYLGEVGKISMSSHRDSLVVVHNSTVRDHVINLRCDLSAAPRDSERFSEFVTMLLFALQRLNQDVEVVFADQIQINASKKPNQKVMQQIQFVQGGDTVWNKGKIHTVTYQN